MSNDYYKLFGLPRSATFPEITKVWKKLNRELHPDVNSAPEAIDKIKRINAAHAAIKGSISEWDSESKSLSWIAPTLRPPNVDFGSVEVGSRPEQLVIQLADWNESYTPVPTVDRLTGNFWKLLIGETHIAAGRLIFELDNLEELAPGLYQEQIELWWHDRPYTRPTPVLIVGTALLDQAIRRTPTDLKSLVSPVRVWESPPRNHYRCEKVLEFIF